MRSIDLIIFMLNTLGFVGYLMWLVSGHQRIFYTQEGVLYLLPCLPFFFVYVFLHRKSQPEDEETDAENGSSEDK